MTYDQLVSEEKSRQVAAAILVGLAAGANAAAAANAGHGTAYGTVRSTTYTPYGTVSRVSTVSASYHDLTAAAIASVWPGTRETGFGRGHVEPAFWPCDADHG